MKKKRVYISLFSIVLFVGALGVLLNIHHHTTQLRMAQPKKAPLTPAPPANLALLPRPNHVVIVVEENHGYKNIIGNSGAPYINDLAKRGVLFTKATGVTHPSEPNYLALFSGSTQGLTSDHCPVTFSTPNLASELRNKGLSFTGYSDQLPYPGFTGCSSKGYFRKHAPWVDFSNLSPNASQPMTAFQKDLSKLPTVSFVIPNVDHDMHNGSIQQADHWLKANLSSYVKWASTHNSLLIITWDEDDFTKANHIPLLMVGPMLKPGTSNQSINHYSILRTIETMYGLPLLGFSQKANPINGIWKSLQ